VSQDVAIVGVKHHGGVHAFEDASVEQADFTAPAFLGRGADEVDVAGQLALFGQGQEGAQRAARNQVVAASVANLGQGVVLRQDGDAGTRARAEAGPERGRQVTDAALDLHACVLLDRVGEPGGCLMLFEAQLRVGVNLFGASDDFRRYGLHGTIELFAVNHGASPFSHRAW
jgi:hypothetical protein